MRYDTPINRAHQTSNRKEREKECSRTECKSEKRLFLFGWHRATLNGRFGLFVYERIAGGGAISIDNSRSRQYNNLVYREVFIIMDQIKTLGFGSLNFLSLYIIRSEQTNTEISSDEQICVQWHLFIRIQLDAVKMTVKPTNKQTNKFKWSGLNDRTTVWC